MFLFSSYITLILPFLIYVSANTAEFSSVSISEGPFAATDVVNMYAAYSARNRFFFDDGRFIWFARMKDDDMYPLDVVYTDLFEHLSIRKTSPNSTPVWRRAVAPLPVDTEANALALIEDIDRTLVVYDLLTYDNASMALVSYDVSLLNVVTGAFSVVPTTVFRREGVSPHVFEVGHLLVIVARTDPLHVAINTRTMVSTPLPVLATTPFGAPVFTLHAPAFAFPRPFDFLIVRNSAVVDTLTVVRVIDGHESINETFVPFDEVHSEENTLRCAMEDSVLLSSIVLDSFVGVVVFNVDTFEFVPHPDMSSLHVSSSPRCTQHSAWLANRNGTTVEVYSTLTSTWTRVELPSFFVASQLRVECEEKLSASATPLLLCHRLGPVDPSVESPHFVVINLRSLAVRTFVPSSCSRVNVPRLTADQILFGCVNTGVGGGAPAEAFNMLSGEVYNFTVPVPNVGVLLPGNAAQSAFVGGFVVFVGGRVDATPSPFDGNLLCVWSPVTSQLSVATQTILTSAKFDAVVAAGSGARVRADKTPQGTLIGFRATAVGCPQDIGYVSVFDTLTFTRLYESDDVGCNSIVLGTKLGIVFVDAHAQRLALVRGDGAAQFFPLTSATALTMLRVRRTELPWGGDVILHVGGSPVLSAIDLLVIYDDSLEFTTTPVNDVTTSSVVNDVTTSVSNVDLNDTTSDIPLNETTSAIATNLVSTTSDAPTSSSSSAAPPPPSPRPTAPPITTDDSAVLGTSTMGADDAPSSPDQLPLILMSAGIACIVCTILALLLACLIHRRRSRSSHRQSRRHSSRRMSTDMYDMASAPRRHSNDLVGGNAHRRALSRKGSQRSGSRRTGMVRTLRTSQEAQGTRRQRHSGDVAQSETSHYRRAPTAPDTATIQRSQIGAPPPRMMPPVPRPMAPQTLRNSYDSQKSAPLDARAAPPMRMQANAMEQPVGSPPSPRQQLQMQMELQQRAQVQASAPRTSMPMAAPVAAAAPAGMNVPPSPSQSDLCSFRNDPHFYHANLTRLGAEEFLKQRHVPPGVGIVRVGSAPGTFALSYVLASGEVGHTRIEVDMTCNVLRAMAVDGKMRPYSSIDNLLTKLRIRRYAGDSADFGTYLAIPVDSNSFY